MLDSWNLKTKVILFLLLKNLVKHWKRWSYNLFLETHGADWIVWERNPPAASHRGGIWERLIGSARAILSALLTTHGKSLDDESLQMLMAEAEPVMNSRSLTVKTIKYYKSFCFPTYQQWSLILLWHHLEESNPKFEYQKAVEIGVTHCEWVLVQMAYGIFGQPPRKAEMDK